MYYLCSENKGADQLRGYLEADLHLCFRICKKPVSHDPAQFELVFHLYKFSDMDDKCSFRSTPGVSYDPMRAYRTLMRVEDIRTCILACTLDKECKKATYSSSKTCYMYQDDDMWPMPDEDSVAFSKTCEESK